MAMFERSTDEMLVSNYETCDSVTGSLDNICSQVQEEHKLDFLGDLGLQFRRLAEISSGSAFELDVKTTHTSPETISTSSTVDVKVEGAVGGVQHETTSVSASGSSSTTQITTTNYENNISGGTTSAATVGQTLLIQQPTVYLSSTPMYVVEQQRHPTLVLASGPMLGVQERNMVLVENVGTNVAFANQSTLPRLGQQQANTRVLVDPVIGGTMVHGISGPSESQSTVSSTFRVVESQSVKSTEPVRVAQSSSHSSISKSHSVQAEGPSGRIMTLENTSVMPVTLSSTQQDVPQFATAKGGAHKQVRQERVSVVKKSVQSSSTS